MSHIASSVVIGLTEPEARALVSTLAWVSGALGYYEDRDGRRPKATDQGDKLWLLARELGDRINRARDDRPARLPADRHPV